MKTLKFIAAFMLLTAGVYSTFAQETRGLRPANGMERSMLSRLQRDSMKNRTAAETSAPDAPESLGKLDPTFGIGGKTTTVLPDDDEPMSINIQPDGKILVTGYALGANGYIINTYVVRYNANGTLDTGFADNGVYRVDFVEVGIYDARATSDGKILLAADKYNPTRNKFDFAVYRLNQNGSLDTTFGTNGFVAVAIGEQNVYTYGSVIQPDGKFVIAGQTRAESSTVSDVGIVRFNADGTLDQTFGTNGKQIVKTTNGIDVSEVVKIGLQTDGKLVFFGDNISGNLYVENIFLFRLNSNGALDGTFGTNGVRLSNFNNNDGASNAARLAIQPDGKILASGFNYNGGGNFIGSTTSRFNPNGTNDTTFGTNGALFTPISSGERFSAIQVLPSGKIMQGGSLNDSEYTYARFALRRLNADGTTDTTFGANGIVSTTMNVYSFGFETLLQPDGKIVQVGVSYPSFDDPADLSLARYLPDAPAAPPFFDFDGDSRADIAVVRGGNWYRLNSSNNSFSGTQFGAASDLIVPADYDGDRRSDLAVFRSGVWYILQSQTNSVRAVSFGQSGDVPMPGDYDGDGKADVAVFRGGNWYILNSANNSFRGEQFGTSTDKPINGDFDADGRQDLAVWRGGFWYVNRSTAGFYGIQFGVSTDKPVAADYDGDGKTDVAVFRPSNGTWYTSTNPATNYGAVQFGQNGDAPVPADYDGDGKADLGVYRAGNWYVLNSVNNSLRAIQFGNSTDTPVEAAYQP